MPWVNIALDVYGFLQQFVFGAGGKGDALARAAAVRAVQAAQEMVNDLGNAVWWGLARNYQGHFDSLYITESARRSFGSAQSATNLAIKHIVQVTFPRSLSYLEGKIVSKHIGPLGSKIAKLNALVGNQKSFRTTNLWGWRNTLADPAIRILGKLYGDWLRFAGWLGGVNSFADVQMPGADAKHVIWQSWQRWQDPNQMVGWFWTRRPGYGDGRSATVQWLDRGDLTGPLIDLMEMTLRRGSEELPGAIVQAAVRVLEADFG